MGALISATTADTVRIECVGEARAVTCPGSVWVEFRDRANASEAELRRVLAALLVWLERPRDAAARRDLARLVAAGVGGDAAALSFALERVADGKGGE